MKTNPLPADAENLKTAPEPQVYSQHTPTPWKEAAYFSGINIAIWSKDNRHVASAYSDTPAEANANAAFIVRCVNSHAALVEALSLLVSYDDRQGKSAAIRELSGNNQDAQTPEEMIYLDGIAAARAALKLATP